MSVSVIIPAHNEQDYLPTLLSSLAYDRRCLHDRLPDYPVEVLVVDNLSTDRTSSVAQSYGARVVQESRRNVSAVRNRGATAASGDYLVFVDADYRVAAGFTYGIIDAFEEDTALVACGVKVKVEENDLDSVRRGVADFALLLLRYLSRLGYGVFAFRRTYFEHLGGFDERFYAYEDVELHNAIRRDLRTAGQHYRVLHHVMAYASGRGFHRGGMVATYSRMFLTPQARRRPELCGYWYDR